MADAMAHVTTVAILFYVFHFILYCHFCKNKISIYLSIGGKSFRTEQVTQSRQLVRFSRKAYGFLLKWLAYGRST